MFWTIAAILFALFIACCAFVLWVAVFVCDEPYGQTVWEQWRNGTLAAIGEATGSFEDGAARHNHLNDPTRRRCDELS